MLLACCEHPAASLQKLNGNLLHWATLPALFGSKIVVMT